ncbi:MAG: M6 family metalloprotease domain-containing protein [Bacteroidales bacterium]|nr:M6 family metalloprotease domain-containing protein [Bacteroidales bacterium]
MLGTVAVYARPVFKSNVPFSQPDGNTFYANVRGDEFHRIITTNSGESIIKDEDGWWSYAVYNDEGYKESTGVHVGAKNAETIKAQSRLIPYDILRERNAAKRSACYLRAPMTKAETQNHKRHGIVIVCEFSDVKLSPETNISSFENLLKQKGYSYKGAEGCALDYFNHQFGDGWDFDFTVVGPVELPGAQADYGGNDKSGNDSAPDQMIVDAIKAADPLVDFSQFDDDGDGYIDNIFVFFAGKDEADDVNNNADCVWSHAWYLVSGAGRRASSVTFDGVVADRYACTSELTITGSGYDFATIGTFCHEFSHTLDLPDYYDTDYDATDGVHLSAGLWTYTSLMDGGNMNNDGNTPPNYNCIDREIIGLIEPQPLAVGQYTLKPIDQEGAVCLRYDHPSNVGEYFLFECRSTKSGWDKYIYGNGLYIYHIDRSRNRVANNVTAAKAWSSNMVNAYHDHQCADLIEASARNDVFVYENFHGLSTNDLKGLPFPYSASRNYFSNTSRPQFLFWDGTESQFAISNITVNDDGSVSFTVSASTVIPEIVRYEYESFQTSAVISWIANVVTEEPAYISIGKTGGKMEEFPVVSYDGKTNYAYVAEDLSPVTEYSVELYYKTEDRKGEVTSFRFQTGKAASKIPPYIILSNAKRDEATGDFLKGCNIPLRTYNTLNAEEVIWTYNEEEVHIGPNGYFNPMESGILKAEILYRDGTSETLKKTVNIR